MTNQLPPHQLSIFLEEYKEIGANLRQYGNMRFAQLTLLVAVSGGLLAAVFSKDVGLSIYQKWAVEFFGLLITVAFWVMEKSATNWWNHYYNCALLLELKLGMCKYSLQKPKTLFSATDAVQTVFYLLALVWLVLIGSSVFSLWCHA